MRTNVITSGSFKGEEAYIHGKQITIGMFKKAKSYVIDEFETITNEYKSGSVAPLAIGAALGGVVGGLLGAALCRNSEVYTKVKIKYGTRYKSTVILEDKEYTRLIKYNKNSNPPGIISIKIES